MRAFGTITTISVVSLLGCTDPSPGGAASNTADPSTLSQAERSRLLFTREEEKLARDVYIALGDYGLPFTNIQNSEQRHFDAVGGLLVTYGLDDPAAGNQLGVFTDAMLQGLYTELVASGTPARLAALSVGCTIEDLDLRDLAAGLAETTHADIRTVYDNLSLGSRNHSRAFYGQLTAAGGAYSPQYIDSQTFDAIVTSPHEQGTPF